LDDPNWLDRAADGFASLLFPGLGQLFQKRFLMAALLLGLEISCWLILLGFGNGRFAVRNITITIPWGTSWWDYLNQVGWIHHWGWLGQIGSALVHGWSCADAADYEQEAVAGS
jgi:hypothetical protein